MPKQPPLDSILDKQKFVEISINRVRIGCNIDFMFLKFVSDWGSIIEAANTPKTA